MNEYVYSEIVVGQKESFSIEITWDMESEFRKIIRDENPLYAKDFFAKDISGGEFKQHIVPGMLLASFLSTFVGTYMPGKYGMIYSISCIRFKEPVYVGDFLTIEGVVEDKKEGQNIIRIRTRMMNQNGRNVFDSMMKVLVLK